MIHWRERHGAIVRILVAGLVYLGCGGGGDSDKSSDAGASQDGAADGDHTPQAAVTAMIRQGDAGTCTENQQGLQWQIGPTPVKNGTSENDAGVGVECQVSGSDSAGYTVTAQATLSRIGSVTIQGHFTTARSPQSSIAVTFDDTGLGKYQQTDCIATYATADQGVSAGRIWTTISCPRATDLTNGPVCDGELEARFENCLK